MWATEYLVKTVSSAGEWVAMSPVDAHSDWDDSLTK